MRAALLVLLAFALLALEAPAQVHKWTDRNGRTHYGDKPPEDAKSTELEIRIPSYDGPPVVRDWSEVLRARPAKERPAAAEPPRGVVMYSTEWCGVCRRARNYFEVHRVAYQKIDIEKSEAGRAEHRRLGGRGVPLIVANGKVIRGFNEKALDSALGR
jgi:glutaredoxin